MSPESRKLRVGVAIAVHNSWGVLKPCLEHLEQSDTEAELHLVVCDDGSTDNTRAQLAAHYPSVQVVGGDGSLWWTGGTNRAVELCLAAGCTHVLLLNPDVFVSPTTLSELLACSSAHNDAVCAAVVVDRDDPSRLVWAGSRWGCLAPGLPIWTNRYLHRPGAGLGTLPSTPFKTHEVHGRAVLFPAKVMQRFGLHDDLTLPHYGGDTEYSLHLDAHGVEMLINPAAVVSLETRTTGLGATDTEQDWSLQAASQRYWKHLWDRKSGAQAPTWWTIARRHVPWYGQLPTFSFIMGLNTLRFWQREARLARGVKEATKHS